MKVMICDKCGKEIITANKIHVYKYRVVTEKWGKQYKPQRKDFEICDSCRRKLIEWFFE